MVKKFYLLISSIFIFIIHVLFVFARVKPANGMAGTTTVNAVSKNSKADGNPVLINRPVTSFYDSLKLEKLGLSRQAFDYALKGFNYLLAKGKIANNNIISIADFSEPSSKKRFFITRFEKL
ncbi:MAG: hypothetical protein WKF59_26165 [Chitinophagaceae bacterium]